MARSRVPRTSRWLVATPVAVAAALVGYGFGVVVAGFAGMMGGATPSWLPLALAGVAGATGWFLRAVVIEGAGDLARRVFMGGDQGTVPEYSVAHALALQGHFEEAVEAYRAGAAQYPEDPEPLLQGARVLQQDLGRLEEAASWLLRARSIPGMAPREEIMVDRALVELYDGPLQQPQRALPILARLAERHAGSRPAEWAARRLAALRTHVWNTVRDDPLRDMPEYQRRTTGRD